MLDRLNHVPEDPIRLARWLDELEWYAKGGGHLPPDNVANLKTLWYQYSPGAMRVRIAQVWGRSQAS